MIRLFLLLVLINCSMPLMAQVPVQTNDNGKKYTAVLLNGAVSKKFDIVFIGDGFTEQDQATFNRKVDEAVAALRSRIPYSEFMTSFNIWRVNVLSTVSGVSRPDEGIIKSTPLQCRYGNSAAGEATRCITTDNIANCYAAAGNAPAYDAIYVLVNDTHWGGCAGDMVFTSIADGFAGIVTHELGHKIGALADEYTCYLCNGQDDQTPYNGSEPIQANITKQKNRTQIKWTSLIATATPVPTTTNNPSGVVGLFEGGGYKPRGLYRPQFACHMQNTTDEFCAVCRDVIRRRLSQFR
jgi:hypothetical protein